jgi:hypothetical protein
VVDPAPSAGISSGAISSFGLLEDDEVAYPLGRTSPDLPVRHPGPLPRTAGVLDGRVYPNGEEAMPSPPLRRHPRPGEPPRVVLDEVQVRTLGIDATVEVRLNATGRDAVIGVANGPAVDGVVLKLAAEATASAIDQLLAEVPGTAADPARCYVEQAAVVPVGSCDVAIVVLLFMFGGWVQQLTGSARVSGDPRQAVVRATLDAVNRRIDALLD